jgi:hypothetical protein
MSLAGIRDAIKTALETISSLRVYDTAPESIGELPAAYILPVSGSYDFDAGGHMTHRFEIVLLVRQGGSLAEAQDSLDAYLAESGASSVKAAVDAASLGTHGDIIRVEGYRDYGGLEYGGMLYLGAKWDVSVIT